ncbi:unnamed protein product [Dovyalis caffra]|uniref:Uncharacterized protein n=1 Tax=Dovyalis caffra TaxID=77055 RepID=A0AAV1QLP5_9ROSI|nr:unnamed protein product [Dovyalis caffra]
MCRAEFRQPRQNFLPSLTLYLLNYRAFCFLINSFLRSSKACLACAEQAGTGFVTAGTVASVKKRRPYDYPISKNLRTCEELTDSSAELTNLFMFSKVE